MIFSFLTKSTLQVVYGVWIPILTCLMVISGCSNSVSTAGNPFKASLQVDLTEKGVPVNRLILGNNVQWVDHGDELLQKKSLALRGDMVEQAKRLGISVLRYPGGSLSDLYRWRDGIGGFSERKTGSRFHTRGTDLILFGTREFLQFCENIKAQPLITVNVVTGSPQEAAEWVKFTNGGTLKSDSGGSLPKVRYWEIGNEPYLVDDGRKELALPPKQFAERANAFIKAMKEVDPTIHVGIPLRSDKFGGIPATPFLGYNDIVLAQVKQPYEFVSLHNAYLPFIFEGSPSKRNMFMAAMAASAMIRQDFEYTRSLLWKYHPSKKIPLAITEYNAFFTIGHGKSDSYISSLAGALYVANILMTFSKTEDLLMANYWSLSGNWYFGAIAGDGKPRPAYYVLEAFNKTLRSWMVSVRTDSPTMQTPAVGFVPAVKDYPIVESLACRDGNTLRMLVINRDPVRTGRISLTFTTNLRITSIERHELFADDYFGGQDIGWKRRPVEQVSPQQLEIEMSPHSLSLLEMQIEP